MQGTDTMESLNRVGGSDHNQILSSATHFRNPETPELSTSSLLTFADMILASSHRQSSLLDENADSDHNYASLNSKTPAAAILSLSNPACTCDSDLSDTGVIHHNHSHSTGQQYKDSFGNLSAKQEIKEEHLPGFGELKIDISDESSSSAATSPQHQINFSPADLDHNYRSTRTRNRKRSDKNNERESDSFVKRSSSVENIQENVHLSPAVAQTSSPRKSCSVEDINNDHDYAPFVSMKSSKSSENVQRHAISQPLHKVVNDRLEFPFWPRKADHTYATATWDGTAVSQSLFGEEVNNSGAQECSCPYVIRDQVRDVHDMEVVETKCNLKDFINSHKVGQNLLFKSFSKPQVTLTSAHPQLVHLPMCTNQKEDHTYANFNSKSTCATFPRHKMRDDHTYFQSGVSKRAGKEWTSMQTVSNIHSNNSSEIYEDGIVQSLPSSSDKDHNYYTSA